MLEKGIGLCVECHSEAHLELRVLLIDKGGVGLICTRDGRGGGGGSQEGGVCECVSE